MMMITGTIKLHNYEVSFVLKPASITDTFVIAYTVTWTEVLTQPHIHYLSLHVPGTTAQKGLQWFPIFVYLCVQHS